MLLIKSITFSITFASIISLINSFNLVNLDNESDEDFVLLNNVESNKRNNEQLKFIYQNYSMVHRNLDDGVIYGESSSKCGGTFKSVQTTIQSPDYPNEYLPNSYCEYIFKSPSVCKNEYHIQFLFFSLESSKDCQKDHLKIGKHEILCGKVIGIMKYKAMDGILKIIFTSDDDIGSIGFNLLVTRLPCNDEESATVFPIYEKRTVKNDEWDDNGVEFTTTFDEESTTENVMVGLRKDIADTSTTIYNKEIDKPTLELQPPIYDHFEESQNKSYQFSYLGSNNSGYLPPPSNDGHSTHTNCFPFGGQYPGQGVNPYPYPGQGPNPYPGQGPNPYPGQGPDPYPGGSPSPPLGFPTTFGYPTANPNYPNTNGYLPPGNGNGNGNFPSYNGYIPPTNGYLPPSGGYPSNNGNFPSYNGYIPPTNGYSPPSVGYPSNNNNFPSYNGYLPPSNGYSPQNPSYYPNTFTSSNYPTTPTNNLYPTNPPNTIYYPHSQPIPGDNDPNIQEISPVRTTFPNTVNEPTYPTRDTVAQEQIFPSAIHQCCTRQFNQQRFYVASSNFPTKNIQNIDCLHYITRNNPGVCRIRIEFKFFYFGNYHPQLGCVDNFIEIDGRRICGCRSGTRYISQWGIGSKIIRVQSRAGIAQGVRGFLLDVIQEQCPFRISRSSTLGGNETNWDRSDPVLHTATTRTNSSSLTTYYYYGASDEKPKSQLETKQEFEQRAEGPNARFFFPPSDQQNKCVFTYFHWLQLVADPLWLVKPSCRR